MDNSIEERLKEIRIEDFIWLVYIGIIFLSWYSNELERRYFIYKDNYSKEKYRKIMILIFSILVIVYYYFLNDSVSSINNLGSDVSYEKRRLNYLSMIASLFIFISGLILLYIAINDKDIDVELAFN